MKAPKFLLAVLVIIGFVASSSFFVLEEGSQGIVTQFGKPVGEPKTKAGLHFKIPFIQKVQFFEKRLLKWDGSPNQIPTRDKKYIWVDTTARWRITKPLVFLQSVATERGALSRLDDIIDSVVRDYVSSHYLIELVRSAGWEARSDSSRGESPTAIKLKTDDAAEAADRPMTIGRLGLTREMLATAQKLTPRYGIELIDIRIKRINYVDQVRKRVFERMISERQRIASQYRSEGEGRKAEILGQMKKELAKIESGAYRKAQEIKGHAEAESTKIYGQAFGQDQEFYSLTKTLEIYKDYPNKNSTMILSTDADFFRYLKGAEPGKMK